MFKKFLLFLALGLSYQSLLPVKIQTGSHNANHEFIADGGAFELNTTELNQLKSALIDGIIKDTTLGDWPAIQLPVNKQTFALLKNMLGDTPEFNAERAESIVHESTVTEFLPLLHTLCFLNVQNQELCRVVAKYYLTIQPQISFDDFAQHAQYITLFFQQDYVKDLLEQAAKPCTCLQILIEHNSYFHSVAFSPDGTKIAAGSCDKTAKLWDVGTYKCLNILNGHADSVISVAFSPDGKKLATGSCDKTAKLWDVGTGQCLQTLTGHLNTIGLVAFSLDGKKLATGSHDCTAKLWDVGTGKCLNTLNGHTCWVYSAEFLPDGTKIATGSWDQTARLWDVNTGQCLQTLPKHIDFVCNVAFSPDGKTEATGSCKKTVRVWAINLNKLQQVFLLWTMQNPGKFRFKVSPFLDEVYASLSERLQQKIMAATGI